MRLQVRLHSVTDNVDSKNDKLRINRFKKRKGIHLTFDHEGHDYNALRMGNVMISLLYFVQPL